MDARFLPVDAPVVFVGPTLTVDAAHQHLEAEYLPPARQGDVYRAAAAGARSIGIIDGFFERVPSVWHKEVLWAMARGARVYGSASMGALRAAELADFGMVGVGRIFDAFRCGELEDDDEVALLHGPAESGYRPGSEPLVNIRATLARAEGESILPPQVREVLVATAKGIHYTERSYTRLLGLADADGVDAALIERLRAWIADSAVDQKAADAVAMLHRMRDDRGETACPAVTYRFENTVYWERMATEAGGPEGLTGSSRGGVPDALYRDRRRAGAVRRAALARLLVDESPASFSGRIGDEEIREVTAQLCAELGIHSDDDFGSWMCRNAVSAEGFANLVRTEAALRMAADAREGKLDRYVLDELVASGVYESLVSADGGGDGGTGAEEPPSTGDRGRAG